MLLQSLLILSVSLLFAVGPATAGEGNKAFLVIDEQKTTSGKIEINPLQIILSESEGEIKVNIHYANEVKTAKDEQEENALFREADILPGGELTLILDDMVILQETFTGNELRVEKILEPGLIINGSHKLRLEIISHPGGYKTRELSFNVDATPVIAIKSLVSSEGIFDPQIYLILFGSSKENVGFLEVHVDENQVTNIPLTKNDLYKTIKLSELTGKELDINGLRQGSHLLRMAAVAANGSQGIRYASFTINTKPEISVETDQNNRFSSFTATFPKTGLGFMGDVEIYYQQGIIFSKQATESHQLTITRSGIEEAFKKHHHTITQYPVDLVFSVRSANGTEQWTRVEFQ